MNTPCHFARLFCLSVVVLSLAPHVPAKTDAPTTNGFVNVRGTVTIDGQTALDGQTIFGRANVVTERGSDSQIVLSNSARLNLAAETDLAVEFAAARLTAGLRSGRVTSSIPHGVRLDLQTTDLSLMNDTADPAVFTIETGECEGTRLSVERGRLITTVAGHTQTVGAGETFSTTGAGPAPPSHLSGKQKAGILATIGGAIAIMLAVALGQNDEDQDNPDFGGCVVVPSPGAPTGCS